MKLGRFVVDTHVHPQRHAVNFENRDSDAEYGDLGDMMHLAVPADEADDDDAVVVYDNSERLLYDMETYGIDMCVLLPAYGMTNEINRQIVERHPEKFVACAHPVKTKQRALRGEEEWTAEAACEELREVLQWDGFVGIGEFLPWDPTSDEWVTWRERKEEIRHYFDVAAEFDVPIRWHPGQASGYSGGGHNRRNRLPDTRSPELAADILPEYPEVDLIFEHGGVSGNWRRTVEEACIVAAEYDNVYLEVGFWWKELLERAFNDPNIGIDQLVFGTDWGASVVAHSHQSNVDSDFDYPSIRWEQISDRGVPAHQVDVWGTTLREFDQYARETQLPQDELNLVLGGNFCELYDVEPPLTRLFPEYVE